MPLLLYYIPRNQNYRAYPIEGLNTHDDLVEQQVELIEDLISIPLAEGNLEHMV